MKASDVINKALAEVGIKEYPPNSNNVKYNTLFYGREVHDGDRPNAKYPWCCTFAWWILSSCGIPVPKTALCTTMADFFKRTRSWFSTPQPGDLVFFKFKTNNRWTNHVGIVVDVKGKEITTVEGNTSINSDDNGGAVMKRKRSSNIVGYGRPQYDDELNLDLKPVLRRGSKGNYVRAWQEYLKTCGISCGKGGSDGIYGNDTEKAVKEYQKLKGLPVTGVIDQDDWNSVGK